MTKNDVDNIVGWLYMMFWAFVAGCMIQMWLFDFGALQDITRAIRGFAFL